jgi:indolepyruvate ferredoxin oxidoreductase alpha subunit
MEPSLHWCIHRNAPARKGGFRGGEKKVRGVIVDSNFFHSGVTGLMDKVYNNAPSTVIILDNRITARPPPGQPGFRNTS